MKLTHSIASNSKCGSQPSPRRARFAAAGAPAFLLLLALGCSKSSNEPGAAESAAQQVKRKPLKLSTAGKASCQSPLVDDVEDGDIKIAATDQRGGFWYTYKDSVGSSLSPEGTYVQTPGGAHGSKQSARIQGTLAASGMVYAGVGLYFTGTQLPYDLSAASGFCFSAKGNGPVRVKLPDVNTSPEGGVCKNCYNSFGKDFELASDWQEYCFDFAKLTQSPNWGDRHEALAANAAFGIQWQVSRLDAPYDLWVDDIRLTCN